ncbi:hypothetical protein LVO39_002534 [Salmonella enterica]|nr:hypothetical protein [Salmonella enterica subsp. enterica serovar Florida]EIQ6926316.1 hypothetical protein [Salmonella enterica]ECF4168171.1 hypothetical protein [Salmonella enterica subsp. enterica serovar Florida]ECW2476800.1 hypothetical protein [Salmonella enterica subsp. enterica serovar Florida]EJS1433416.1 hypothetical protein [Salmonella enterica]
MNETELKHVIAMLLEDAKRLQQVEPNAGTEARIWVANEALNSVRGASDRCGCVSGIATESRKLIKDSMGVYDAHLDNSQEMEKAPANLRIHKGNELTDNQKMDYKVLATNLRQAAEHLDACAGWAEMSVGRFTQSDPAVRK